MIDKRKISIPDGGMYQEWCHLSDLVDEKTAKRLENKARSKGWRIVQPDEALDMGFEELVYWSVPETDVLVIVDEKYLVCLLKEEVNMN